MQIQRLSFCTVVISVGLITTTAAQQSERRRVSPLPSDPDVHTILAERVDRLAGREGGIGIVVGLVGPNGRRIISYGRFTQRDPRPLDGDTLFEIGSITKVFTALLLADMAHKGEVSLEDPVAKHLPRGVTLPKRHGHSITLLDLATHTSGLPIMTDDAPNFYESASQTYSARRFYDFLARYKLPPDSGTKWDYSNVGYWLLGESLASRVGSDYETLLVRRVIRPLNLQNTGFTFSRKVQLAVGHNAVLEPAPSVSSIPSLAIMPATGGLLSSANDLLTLLSVCLGYEPSPLSTAASALLATRRRIDVDAEQALGWMILGVGEDQLVVHDGGTLGYSSAVAWNPKKRVGVVVLSNQVSSVTDIARHFLWPNVPLAKPAAAKRIEVTLSSGVLDRYVGLYEATGEGEFLIARGDGFLTVQLPPAWGLPKLRLRPENSRDFFVAELPLRLTFRTDADEGVSGLLIYPPRGQRAVLAQRKGP